ncbi:YicC/YloC family endoribonuclease [Szabonella alba]|uniref:YicC family protein n=1 Tax=Szabonella alba TaxID=2804194 RepID=A0A8K0V9C1_9RHOB|nr:YicC/YloC family endoribonuclease [Szabonella alba]MBL4917738.1 YicC family protein [Szabonella alba]
MTLSMTGFAARRSQAAAQGAVQDEGSVQDIASGWSWAWDIRAVNGKGLDLRLRVPDWIEGLEPALRAELGRAIARGNVSLSLKLTRETGEATGLRVNRAALTGILSALAEVEAQAMAAGVTLRQAGQAEVLGFRGVLEQAAPEEDMTALRAAILADLPPLLADFATSRAAEGAALHAVIAAQIDRVAALTEAAAQAAGARRDHAAQALREALARVLDNTDGVEPSRVAQELALIAVKSDITEELDRLRAHIAAARGLLADTAPVGRRFDFLMQEFMREANTLCSKAQSSDLTRLGLDLKTVIDQMREQVQNVE